MEVEMTPQRWQRTAEYGLEVFGRPDKHLAGLMRDGVAAGLPDIAVDGQIGRLADAVVTPRRCTAGTA